MKIHYIEKTDRDQAISLVLSVFMEFEAPEYSKEGIESFRTFVSSHEELNSLTMYGAYEDDRLVGVIATRKQGTHISLFFVDPGWQGTGIGRKLFEKAVSANTSGTITVNSSPYAVPIYQHLGFVCTDTEQVTDGIRYTPMIYQIPQAHGFSSR